MATRIYIVTDGAISRLVRATHPSHALMHVVRDNYTVRVASQDDLETQISKGVKVEKITAEQQEIDT